MNHVLIISDEVYSLPATRINLIELIRHNLCEKIDDKIIFSHIPCKNLNDGVCKIRNKTFQLNDLSKKATKKVAYILCGLQECTDGYGVSIFETHLNGIVNQLDFLKYEVVFINPIIQHGLKGHIGGWYKRSFDCISNICEDKFCRIINPNLKLTINDGVPIIKSSDNRSLLDNICNDIESTFNEMEPICI